MFSSDESSDCGKETRSFSRTNDKGNFCSMCQEVFPDFFAKVDHHCLPYKCKLCNRQFEYDFRLKIHKCQIENIDEAKSHSFKCKFCDLQFVTSSLLELHENSCSEKKEQCDNCKVIVSSSADKRCECKILKNKKRPNRIYQSRVSCNGDALIESETYITESNGDVSYSESSDQLKDINCKSKLNDHSMDTRKRGKHSVVSSVKNQPKANKCPSNVKNSVIHDLSDLPVKDKLHFSGKFRNSKRIKNKASCEINKAADNNKKLKSKAKKQVQNSKILEDEISDITTESSSATLFCDIVPEIDTPASEELSSVEMSSKRSRVSKLPQKFGDVNLLKGDLVESFDKNSKKEMAKKDISIMKNFAKKLKFTLESSSNITFNGIHSSHSVEPKNKPQLRKQANKNSKKRKTNLEAADFHISEKGESGFSSAHSSRDSSPVKRKTRKSRSSSREHDSGVELIETSSSSSMSNSSVLPKIKNPTKTKKVSSSVPVIDSSVQESNSQQPKSKKDVQEFNFQPSNSIKDVESNSEQSKSKKDNLKNKSVVTDSGSVLSKGLQQIPLELEISESTLNDIPDNIDSVQKWQPKLKEDFYVKERKSLPSKLKTENSIELGDLLNALPAESGVLLKASPGSFHNYRCPKCNKLFKHLKTGSNHLISCRAKFKKSILINYNVIFYVCTACHYNSTRKIDLTHHKMSCSSNSITDILYGSNEEVTCPRCSFSCLSRRMYNLHPCTERLEYMKTCIVNLEKISPVKCKLSDGTSILLNSIKCEMPDGTPSKTAMTSQVCSHVAIASSQKHKKIFAEKAEPCKTVEDVMKNIVNPVLQFNQTVDFRNPAPDLHLDMTIPYENQKLLAEAAGQFFSGNFAGLNEGIFKIQSSFDEDGDFDDSNLDPQADKVLNLLKHHSCKCKNKMPDPNGEKKPCVSCLNAFLKKHVLSDPELSLQMPNSAQSTCDPNTTASSVNASSTSSASASSTSSASASSASSASASSTSAPSTSTTVSSASTPSTSGMSAQITSTPSISCTSASSYTTLQQKLSIDAVSIADPSFSCQSLANNNSNSLVGITSHISDVPPVGDKKTESSDIGTNSTSANVCSSKSAVTVSPVSTCANNIDPSPELPLRINSSSEPSTSHSQAVDDKCASSKQILALFTESANKILDLIEKDSEDIPDDSIPSVNQEAVVPLDAPSCSSTNSSTIQIVNANSVPNEPDLPTSDGNIAVHQPVVITKNKFEFTFSHIDCSVACAELRMTVTAPTSDFLDSDFLDNEDFQDMLIDLQVKLKETITTNESSNSFESAITVICENKFNVEIVYQSVHLYIHFTYDASAEYSAYLLKATGQCMCTVCEGDFSPSSLIKHAIQVHKENKIYISVII